MIFLVNNKNTIVKSDNYQLASIDDVVDYCKDKKTLGVDTETEGMDFVSKKIVMFQIGDENNQFVIDSRSYDIEPLREILENKDIIDLRFNAFKGDR